MDTQKTRYKCTSCGHIYMSWEVFCTKCGSYAAVKFPGKPEKEKTNAPNKKRKNPPFGL